MTRESIVERAILDLTEVCDGAVKRDHVGWNGTDSQFGHAMAQRIIDNKPLTSNMRKVLAKILPKYHRQIPYMADVKSELPSWVQDAVKQPAPSEVRLPRLDYRSEDDRFYLYTAKEHREVVREIPNGRFMDERGNRYWRFMNRPESRQAFIKLTNEKWFGSITQDAYAILQAEHNTQKARRRLLHDVVRIKKGTLVPDRKMPILSTPYQHQIKAFHIATTLDHSALLMEQGTGKTLSALATAGYRYQQGQVKRLLITCPLSVVSEWERQFEEHADFPAHVKTLTDSLDIRRKQLEGWDDTAHEGLQVVVLNYDVLHDLSTNEAGEYRGALIRWKPDMVIADESQRIKNGQAQRSKALTAIGKEAAYRMILTGTPITEAPLNVFSQYKFLDNTIFGNSFTKFRDRYAIRGGYGGHQIVGYQNLEELAEKVHSIAFRVKRSECLDLPPTANSFVYAQLEPQAARIYREMEKEALATIGDRTVSAPIVLTKILRCQQITGGFLPSREDDDTEHIEQVSSAKLQVLEETLEDLMEDPNRKVVVFARFKSELDAISKLLTKMKLKHVVLKGGVKQKARKERMADFQGDKHTKVFLSQIATGGVGVTLTAADTCIFYSLDFSSENYEQARPRVDRIGQTKPVTYIHILVRGTWDEQVMAALAEKRDISKFVVDELRDLFLKETTTILPRINRAGNAKAKLNHQVRKLRRCYKDT